MRSVSVVAALVGFALTACGESEPAGGALPPPSDVTSPATTDPARPTEPAYVGPYDPTADIRPDLIEIEPNPVDAGEFVAVTFPEGTSRGVAYVLEVRVDDEWYATHFMTAATDGYEGEPTWAAVGTEGYGGDDVGVEGPGPDTLIVPDAAVAGDYRVCTANSLENICSELTILKADDSPLPDGWLYGVDPPQLEGMIGLPLDEFERRVSDIGWGPVRVAVEDGEPLSLTDDLVPGRVNVATEDRAGTAVVVDAAVEVGEGWTPGDPVVEATIVGLFEAVEFYPACGNEVLEHQGVVWYQVQEFEYPELHDRAVNANRENPPESVTVRPFAPRVAEPGPGDDVGTLVVWSDAVAYFVSDSGDLHVWLVQDELTYNWVC